MIEPGAGKSNPAFAARKGGVLIVEAIGPFRDALRRTVLGFGFKTAIGVGTARDAIGYLETETLPAWIITASSGENDSSVLQLLALIVRTKHLRDIRVSHFHRPDEGELLKTAFELGLMSCHPAENKTVAVAEFELRTVMQVLARSSFDTIVVAAHYLRSLLRAGNDAPAMYSLEKELLQLYPRSAYQMLNVAEAAFLTNKAEEGRAVLAQARFANPAISERADRLYERYLGAKTPGGGTDRNRFADVFQIRNCLVVDTDATVHRGVTDALGAIGVPDVHCEADAAAAYGWLRKHGEPGLIVTEWKLPGLGGNALIQRTRDLGFHNVPIFVLTGGLTSMQRNLVREMGAAGVADKPFSREAFLRTMVTGLRASYFPTHYRVMERKMMALIAKGRLTEARTLKDKVLAAKDAIPPEARKLLEARFLFADGDFEATHRLATELVQEDPDNLTYQDLLGKVLLKMGEFEASVMCFNRAQSLAPDNVERMCGIADALTELGEFERADGVIGDARKVDADSMHVHGSNAKLGLISGDVERAQRSMRALESNSSVLAYLNNRAVAYARSGRYAQSVHLYQDALKAIPLEQTSMRAIVTYNLGLAFVRAGNLSSALQHLEAAHADAQGRFRDRTSKLLGKVRNAIKNGTPLLLESGDSEVKNLAAAGASDPNDIPARIGEICCHGLFKRAGITSANELLRSVPSFKRRNVITRGDTKRRTSGWD